MNGYYKLFLMVVAFFYYSLVNAQTDTLTYLINAKYKYYVCSSIAFGTLYRKHDCIKRDSSDYTLPDYMRFHNLFRRFGFIETGIGQRFSNYVFAKPEYTAVNEIKNRGYFFHILSCNVYLYQICRYEHNELYNLYDYLFHDTTEWDWEAGLMTDLYYKVTFCPQINIMKYDIWGDDRGKKIKSTIELSSINGKPLSDFMKESKCITPFCDF